MIIADENIFDFIISNLRENGYYVFSIKESMRGASDVQIAELSLNPPRIIITEDKDFGNLVFSGKINLTGCILLRNVLFNEKLIAEILLNFLKEQSLESLKNKFVTITPDKIRINEF